MKAKYSNLSARTINILVALATITISALLLIFAPTVAEAIAKVCGLIIVFALLAGTLLYAITWKPINEQ